MINDICFVICGWYLAIGHVRVDGEGRLLTLQHASDAPIESGDRLHSQGIDCKRWWEFLGPTETPKNTP